MAFTTKMEAGWFIKVSLCLPVSPAPEHKQTKPKINQLWKYIAVIRASEISSGSQRKRLSLQVSVWTRGYTETGHVLNFNSSLGFDCVSFPLPRVWLHSLSQLASLKKKKKKKKAHGKWGGVGIGSLLQTIVFLGQWAPCKQKFSWEGAWKCLHKSLTRWEMIKKI